MWYLVRVKEHYLLKWNETIPLPFELDGYKHCYYVTTAFAKFDVYLKQLAKVPLAHGEINDMLNTEHLWEKRISPNPSRYSSTQWNSLMIKMSCGSLRFDKQEFLRLKTPIREFELMPKENANNEWHPEYIDICKRQYSSIRERLITQGRISSQWILNKFIYSEDVIVSDVEFF